MTSETQPTPEAAQQTQRVLERLATEQGLELRGQRTASRRLPRSIAISVAVSIVVASILIAAFAGWRLVIIRSGSMGDKAPLGALAIVSARPAEEVSIGDVIVMQRDGAPNITHEVSSIESVGASRFARTKGDANSTLDPLPYPLDGDVLTVRAVVPHLGRVAALSQTHWLGLLLLLAALYVMVDGDPAPATRPRREWSDPARPLTPH